MEQDTTTFTISLEKKPLVQWTSTEVQQWLREQQGGKVAMLFHEDGASLAQLTTDDLLEKFGQDTDWSIKSAILVIREISNFTSQQQGTSDTFFSFKSSSTFYHVNAL